MADIRQHLECIKTCAYQLVDIKNQFGDLQIILCLTFWGSEWLGFNQAARLVDDWGQGFLFRLVAAAKLFWDFRVWCKIEARNA